MPSQPSDPDGWNYDTVGFYSVGDGLEMFNLNK